MSNSENNLRIDYVEFLATDIKATKRFYTQAFRWKFEDYGPDYTSFHDGRLGGGFTDVDPIQRGEVRWWCTLQTWNKPKPGCASGPIPFSRSQR